MAPTMTYFDTAAAHWDDQPHRVRLMRAIGDAIVRQANPAPDAAVLDYGCGTGLVGLYLLPHVASVTGADNSRGMLDVLDRKIREGGVANMRPLLLDLERDPVPPDRYDLIVSGMALHHIADTARVLRAFHELLRPTGALCLADLDTEPGTFHPDPAAAGVHHHGFDRERLMGQLERIGFTNPHAATAATFTKPVADGGQQEFSIFLITAGRA